MNTAPPSTPPHPMLALAARIAPGDDWALMPATKSHVLHEAVTAAGTGLDYPMGECALGALYYDFVERGRAQGSTASVVLTDRRMIGRIKASNVPDTTLDVPFAFILGARVESGLLNSKLHVQMPDRVITLPMWGTKLQPFFQELPRVPPEYRAFPAEPPLGSAQDPIGAHAARARLAAADFRPGFLLHAIAQAVDRGMPPDVARDLVGRVRLFDRGLRTGRGMHQGEWLSTLAPDSLAGVLQMLLGPPLHRWREPNGEGLEFPVSSDAMRRAASNVVGVALFALAGVGWLSFSGGPEVRAVRVLVGPKPCGSGFVLLGSTGGPFVPLSYLAPRFVSGIHTSLFGIEARVMLGRVLSGPADTDDVLLSIPASHWQERAGALVGPVDLGPFFARDAG